MGANACHNAEDARDALQVDSLDVMTTSEHKGNEGAMLSEVLAHVAPCCPVLPRGMSIERHPLLVTRARVLQLLHAQCCP